MWHAEELRQQRRGICFHSVHCICVHVDLFIYTWTDEVKVGEQRKRSGWGMRLYKQQWRGLFRLIHRVRTSHFYVFAYPCPGKSKSNNARHQVTRQRALRGHVIGSLAYVIGRQLRRGEEGTGVWWCQEKHTQACRRIFTHTHTHTQVIHRV